MKNKISLSTLVVALLFRTTLIHAQNPVMKVFEDWHDTIGTQHFFHKCVTRYELGTTNVYIAGATKNSSGNYDMLVAKYNTSGALLWQQQYDGAGHGDDVAIDVQYDNSGNVYITGSEYESSADSSDAITIMYDSNGNQQWASTFNGNGSANDGTAALYVDNSTGEVYSVGSEWIDATNKYDFLVLKYDNSGNLLWYNNYDYGTGGSDGAGRVMLNGGTGYLDVGGAVQDNTASCKYAVISFDPASGGYISGATSGGNTFGLSKLTDMKEDNSGNIFVTGGVVNTGVGYDIKTIKLDTALSVVWSATYNGAASLDDIGSGLSIDSHGNIIVTGFTTTTSQGKNYVTIKYNSSGTQQWAQTFDGAASGTDSATAIVVRDTNQIYVTGYSYNGSTNDYYTLKYDKSGNLIWQIGFNSLENGDDRATDIATDTIGEVFVTGESKLNDTTLVYNTVKYLEKKTLLPQDTIAVISNSFVFTENRGQLLNINGDSIPQVRYYTVNGAPILYFTDTAVSYVWVFRDTSASHNDTLARVDMKFLNSNSGQHIRAMGIQDDYYNFYLSNIPKGRAHVQNYNQLISYAIWNNVDIIYGNNQRGLKYYFVCKPSGGGGSSSQVDLKYNGADSVKIDGSGQLIIYTRFGKIVQPKAAAWQIDGSGNYSSLGWQPSYNIVATNEVKFTSLGSYNTTLPLIIAVDWGNISIASITNPRWSTYLGGTNDDWGQDIKVNASDYVFTTGQTFSTNFPVYLAYNSTSNAIPNVYIGCFKPDRSRKWVTYCGGSSDDGGTKLAVGSNGYIYCTGFTYSSNFPAFSFGGSYSELSTSSTSTGFLIRLDQATGYPDFSTRFGENNTTANSIAIDASDNVYITGDTKNSTAGNTTNGAPPTNGGFPLYDPGSTFFNNVHSSGSTIPDAYIAKFSSTGHLAWSTYFGGNGIDQGFDLAIDGNNTNLYLVGLTSSSTASNNSCGVPTNNGFPICAPTVGTYYQSSLAGGKDGFLSTFDLSTMQLGWSTYLGGTNDDMASGITISPNGSIYVAGTTSTSTPDATSCATPTGGGFPNCSNSLTYSQTYSSGGGTEAFILKFKSEDLIWGSYLGGSGDEGYPSANPQLTHDSNGNIYTSITTFSPNTSISSPAYTQHNTGMNYNQTNNKDATFGHYAISEVLLYTFTPANQMLWGSYFGGVGALALANPQIGEMVSGIACGGNSLFITGILYSTTLFPLAGPYSTSYLQGATTVSTNPGGGDAFISEFDIAHVLQGVQENSSISGIGISIFPNPVNNGSLNISIHSSNTEQVTLKIYDVIGNLVFEQPTMLIGDQYTVLDVSGYSQGMYFIHVENSKGLIQTEKFIIQK